MRSRILIAEDDAVQAELLAETLRSAGHDVLVYPDGLSVLRALEVEATPADLLLTDLTMPQLDGLELCKALRESRPDLPVVVVTADATPAVAVAAIKAGAYDYLTKPVEPELLKACVHRALERRRLARELNLQGRLATERDTKLFGQGESMERVRELVAQVASSGASVLVHGETGTGKELVARALHALSPRAEAPFVAVNCAALPAALVESELFGYAKEAFTDARAARVGLFVGASGGTLFLDEVADLSLESQAKVLRALQERTVRPLGSNTEEPFDARVICATHVDLESAAEAGRFRQDLFYRLNVVRIDLPPLRDRGMDVVHLASRFMQRVCERDQRPALKVTPEVAEKLVAYSWPGNVRELENCMDRLAALAKGPEVSVADLPEKVRAFQRGRFQLNVDEAGEILPLDEVEKRYILRVLQLVQDNRSRAAEVLGIDRRTLYRRLEGWGLPTQRSEQDATPAPPVTTWRPPFLPPISSRRRLLVIDDDAVNRMAVCRALSTLGVVDEAVDAGSAVSAVRGARYDLVIVDYFLPPDTGPEVLSRLRALQPGLAAVFLSGSGTEEVAVEAMKAGGEDFLPKSEESAPAPRRGAGGVRAAGSGKTERSQARLALAVEAARLGTWSYEPGAGLFRGDARFATLLGLPGDGAWPIEVVLGLVDAEAGQRLSSALEAGEVSLQVPLRRSGWVDLRGRLEASAPWSVFGTALDVSAQKEAERRSTSLREKLMGVASHELKNPLSAVKQASALLAQSQHLDEKERRFVAHIRSSAERMTNLIVQLLDLTRVRLGGGLPLTKVRTPLKALVVGVIDELRLTHPERIVQLDLADVEVEVDPDRFAQLVSNLAGNALKHSPVDSTVRVELSEGNNLVLAIHNEGEPIPLGAQASIFEPFVQLGAAATRDGLGLGLYISREILHAHGGTLLVDSSAGAGTRFTARFPLGDISGR